MCSRLTTAVNKLLSYQGCRTTGKGLGIFVGHPHTRPNKNSKINGCRCGEGPEFCATPLEIRPCFIISVYCY